jgi:hypothetical protein
MNEPLDEQPAMTDEEHQARLTQLDTVFAASAALSGLPMGEIIQVHLKAMVDLAVESHEGKVPHAIEHMRRYTTQVFDGILEDHGKPKLILPH